MKIIAPILSLAATIVLILFLNGNIFCGSTLPAFGKMLNPFTGIWTNTIKSKDNVDLTNSKIDNDIEIILDSREVPHIYTATLGDALYAQGMMVAKARYFQMDMMSRAASGRVAEVAGPARLDFDIKQRRKGMTFAADQAIKGWKKFPESYQLLERYVDGVNDVIQNWETKDYPLEYKLLNVNPEPWTIYKTVLVAKMMADDLAGRDSDIKNTNMLAILGKDVYFELYDEHENIETPIIADTYLSNAKNMRADTQWTDFKIKPIYNTDIEAPIRGLGSNNWAISGSKTKSGNPIFANDPHLKLSLPSIWYEVHIMFDDINTYGVTIPGMPGIMMGWNDHIAWGETNVGQDIKDYYNIEWVDDQRTQYLLDGKPTEVRTEIETYNVKGGETYYDTMRYTVHGPVIYYSRDGKSDLAVRWLSHDEPRTAEYTAFINGFQSKSYDEYLEATEVFVTPAQNFLAASKHGDIGLRVNGLFPKKGSQDGRFVKKGSIKDNLWKEYIPRDENPQVKNPTKGWIASSNQVSASKNYPYYFTGWFENYRNRTIDSLLLKMDNITPADMMEMQQNNHSEKAKDILPVMLSVIGNEVTDELGKEIISELSKWNYNYEAEYTAPTYFDIWFKNIFYTTWDEMSAFADTMQVIYPESWKTIELIKNNPDHAYFDNQSTLKQENAEDIIRSSFTKTISDLTIISNDKEDYKWDNYSPMNIYHLLRLPALSKLNIRHTGCAGAINASRNNMGPSWRMVVDLGNKPMGHTVNPGGQNGNPLSAHYYDGIEMWEYGKYNKVDIYQSKSKWLENGHSINIIKQ